MSEEKPVRKGDWVSAEEFLREYDMMETRELQKRRFYEWLMKQQWTSEGRKL